jgi:hypothetical protein
MTARQRLRRAAASRLTLGVFGFLALGSLLPVVVDVYDSPVYLALGLPSYLVTMLFYDSPWGLENLVYPVYPVAETLLGDGHLLWESGRFVTFYLFAVVVGWVVATVRSGPKPESQSPDATQ